MVDADYLTALSTERRGEQKTAKRPSQNPISKIRGLGEVSIGKRLFQDGILWVNQSCVGVNSYSFVDADMFGCS